MASPLFFSTERLPHPPKGSKKKKKKLYNSIKRLCFYISYKKIILYLLILHTEDRRKKPLAYSFFKLSDLLLVCNDKNDNNDNINTIRCENGSKVKVGTRRRQSLVLCSVRARSNEMSGVQIWSVPLWFCYLDVRSQQQPKKTKSRHIRQNVHALMTHPGQKMKNPYPRNSA